MASLPNKRKNYATTNAFGGPSRPASLVAYPARGMQPSYAMTRRDFGKPAFSLRKKRFVKTHALSLLGTTRLLSRSVRNFFSGFVGCGEESKAAFRKDKPKSLVLVTPLADGDD